MANKSIKLEHVIFGTVTVVAAWVLASDEPYVECTCFVGSQKRTKKLLVEQQYWISDEADVQKAFNLFYSKELLRRKNLSAKSNRASTQTTKAEFVSPDRRQRSLSSDNEAIANLKSYIEELQIEDTNDEFTPEGDTVCEDFEESTQEA